jgi:hypothetical protein
MKTNIFNITALALLITTGFIATTNSTVHKALFNRGEITTTTISADMTLENSNINYVKAEMIDGELMPVVDLPEFKVVSEYNDEYKVKAKYVNGELLPVVDLPELTIEG